MLASIYHMLMSISIELMLVAIPIILNIIFFYFALKYSEKRAISIVSYIIETEKANLKPTIEAYINTDEFKAALYEIGGYFGAGAMSGTGINSGKGKMKMKDLGIQLFSKFIDQIPSRPGLNLRNTQNLKANRNIEQLQEA
jgi:hypothetical protein